MSKKSAHVLLLCGLPGCGKSTLARRWKESNDETSVFDRILHIEYDSVARVLQQEQQQTTSTKEQQDDVFNEDSLEAWRCSRKVVLERLDQELQHHFMLPNDNRLLVILDDNFHLRSMRKNVYQTCQSHANEHLYFNIVWLDVPLNVCLERNQQRTTGRVPNETITKMLLEPPDPNKASWEQGWIHCKDASDASLELVLDKSQVVQPPPPPVDPQVLEMERRKTRESRLHTYDGYLRSWVGAVARIRKSDAGKANAARKDILQRFRKDQQDTSVLDETLVMTSFADQVCSGWKEEEIIQLKTAMQSTLDLQS